MIGLKISDINRDTLIIFTICYEYGLSFTNVMKLYNISKKYFWTFLEICNPMLKLGIRKAANIRKSVDNILPYLESREIGFTNLTPKEDKILEAFSWYLQDSFTDGDGCLHVTQFKSLPNVKGYTSRGNLIAYNYDGVLSHLDRLEYVTLGSERFYKTSRFLYYMEKFSGDTDLRELNNLSVPEMLKRIAIGEENTIERARQEIF